MTDGYREGLSVGKAKVMQRGFDAGYPVGVQIGLRVGSVLGILEGVLAALASGNVKDWRVGGWNVAKSVAGRSDGEVDEASLNRDVGGVARVGSKDKDSASGREEDVRFVQSLYARAQEELKITELLKGLGDKKIAAIPDAQSREAEESEVERKNVQQDIQLPGQIEWALMRWEALLLGSLRMGRS